MQALNEIAQDLLDSPARVVGDAMKVYLLDMGAKIYGDCILVVQGDRKLLVDGGHPGDWRGSPAAPSIPDQLRGILGHPPFKIDLLVVTHCHSDHIGCLPKMVADGTVEFEWALVADEAFGFPTDAQDDALDNETLKVVASIVEEPQPDLRGTSLDEFLSDAAQLSNNYREMLRTLENANTRIIRYTGPDAAKEIEREFADFELRVIGPTTEHLKLCSAALAKLKRNVRDAVENMRGGDALLDAAQLYRRLVSGNRRADAAIPDGLKAYLDRAGPGAALNDQSIVIRLGNNDESVLLTGDMQLAKAEIAGLDDSMDSLLDAIAQGAPYKFVKLPHHASYNGFNQKVLDVLKGTQTYGISTGRGDPNHPDSGVLNLLGSISSDHRWSRTDKNGVVLISFKDGEVLMNISKGELNDISLNTADVLPASVELPVELRAEPPQVPIEPGLGPGSVLAQGVAENIVEVFACIPHVRTRVTITVDVEPQSVHGRAPPPGPRKDTPREAKGTAAPSLGAGRELPHLLFVTNKERLAKNIGKLEADDAIASIKTANQRIIEFESAAATYHAIQNASRDDSAVKGVVILGGYDVVMSERVDTLPPSVRSQLGSSADNDPDDFIVWSDQIFGDLDGDGLADVPVSRIPDGRSAKLVQAALYGSAVTANAQRFGLRNYARPFADRVYSLGLSGSEAMLTSRQMRSQSLVPAALNAKFAYLMLHGSDVDCSRFWGETQAGMLEAMYVGNIPAQCGAVVFSGCCWGALPVRTRAMVYRDGDPLQPLTPEQSIALTFLERGARAFIGCTGAHYSPVDGNLDYFGAPMHHGFWTHFASGKTPAEALFSAKIDYIRGMPHGRSKVEEIAIENKILRQFTCLGFGW